MAGPSSRERPTEAAVRDRLRNVIDPCSAARGTDHDVIEMGLLSGVDVDGGHVKVRLRLTTPACMMVTNFVEQIEEHVGSLPSVESVDLETDGGHEWRPHMMSEDARARRETYLERLEERYESES